MTDSCSVAKTPAERGLKLYRERGNEIRRIERGVYAVPSCSKEGVEYRTNVLRETCSCPATVTCVHIFFATVHHAKMQVRHKRAMAEVA